MIALAVVLALATVALEADRPLSPVDSWAPLRRPLRIPSLVPGASCPRTRGGRSAPRVAITLGDGPAYPVLGMEAPPPAPGGVARLRDDVVRAGWRFHKTLWAISPRYRGRLLIRGRRVDGQGRVRFHLGGPLRREIRWLPERRPWRYGGTSTLLRGPGCFAFQVDGVDFSDVIVFRATR